MARAYDEEDHPLSERGIEQRNHALLRRYREFRRGADAVTAAWRAHPEVIAVSLIGSWGVEPDQPEPRGAKRPRRRAVVVKRLSKSGFARLCGMATDGGGEETPAFLVFSTGGSPGRCQYKFLIDYQNHIRERSRWTEIHNKNNGLNLWKTCRRIK